MTSASRGNASGGHVVAGAQIQPGALVYTHLSAALQGSLAGFRNKIINGNFDIWQRGTSLAAAAGSRYLADRWIDDSSVTTIAPSRQAFALGQTDVPGEPAYFHRSVVASSAGAANYAQLIQRIEGVRTLAGQTAMLSFYAKADASKNIAVEFSRLYGTGGSPSATDIGIGAQLVPLTTAWKQFKIPVTIPSIAGKTLGTNGDDWLGLNFWLDAGSNYSARAASLGQQSGTFDIARVKLEAGADATPDAPRPLALELLLCQRFYEVVHFPSESRTAASILWGNATPCAISAQFKAAKRATPTITELSPGTQTHTRVYVPSINMVYVQPPQASSGDWWSYGLVAAANAEL